MKALLFTVDSFQLKELETMQSDMLDGTARDGSKINNEPNKIGLWEWFDKNAKEGWTIELVNDGKNNNRTYNVYDDKKSGIGSWDEVDGWQWNSMF